MTRIPFDFEKYKAGWKAVTRDGRVPSEIVRLDTILDDYKIIAVINGHPSSHFYNGKRLRDLSESDYDLFLEPPVKETYITVYETGSISGPYQKYELYFKTGLKYTIKITEQEGEDPKLELIKP